MPLPTSGPISARMIAENMEISNANLNLNDSRARDLAEIPQGRISYADFYGKHYYDYFQTIDPRPMSTFSIYFPPNNANDTKTSLVAEKVIVTTEPLPGYTELNAEINHFYITFDVVAAFQLNNIPINASSKFIITDGIRSERFGLQYVQDDPNAFIKSNSGYLYKNETINFNWHLCGLRFFIRDFDTNFKQTSVHYISMPIGDVSSLPWRLDFVVVTNGVEVFRTRFKVPKRFRRYYYRSSLGKNYANTAGLFSDYNIANQFFKFTYGANTTIQLNSKYNLTQKEIEYIRKSYPYFEITGSY